MNFENHILLAKIGVVISKMKTTDCSPWRQEMYNSTHILPNLLQVESDHTDCARKLEEQDAKNEQLTVDLAQLRAIAKEKVL